MVQNLFVIFVPWAVASLLEVVKGEVLDVGFHFHSQ